jgi:hypothetical protein
MRRCIGFHRDAAMSGGKKGLALAGVVSLALGGSVGALLTWLADVSWLVAATVALAALFVFYGWGAYRVWDKADHRAQDAVSALEDERAKPQGPVGFNVAGGSGNTFSDCTTLFVQPPAEATGRERQSLQKLNPGCTITITPAEAA